MRSDAIKAFGSGWFSDVAFAADGRLWLIAAFDIPDGAEMRVLSWAPWFADERVEATAGLIEGYGYSRIASLDEQVWFGWHDGVRGYYQAAGGQPVTLEPCQGSSPLCFGAGAIAWQGAQTGGWPVSLRRLVGGPTASHVRNGVGTGLSRIIADTQVVTVDEDRFALIGATIPCFSGDLAVGEAPDGGIAWRLGSDTAAERGVLMPGQFTGTPRCATAGDLVAICASGAPGGIRVFWGTRAELLGSRVVPPKDPPVDDLKFPFPDGYDPRRRLEAVRSKFRTPIMVEGQYDDRPQLLIGCCEAVGYGAGLLRKNSGTHATLPDGTNVSQDWMEFPNKTALDFITDGENTAGVGWGEAKPSQGERVDVSQWFTGGGPVDPPIDPPTEAPAALTTAMDAIIAAFVKRDPGAATGTDAQKRTLTTQIAKQLAFSVNRKIGTKRAAPDRDLSKNAIAFQSSPLVGYVLFTDLGQVIPGAKLQSMAGQVFEAVTPEDILHIGNDDPPIDPPDGDLAAAVKALGAQLTALSVRLGAAEATVAAHTTDLQAVRAAATALEARVKALE